MKFARCTLLGLAAVLVQAAFSLAQEPATAAPKLLVPELVKDFGSVAQGEVLNANFKLENHGTQALQVKAVRPTCGCTVVEFDREIAPGKEGWVKAKLDTTGFAGPISKSILIVTDDPASPTVSVVIKADVQPYLEVLPRPLLRFNAIQGEAATQTVKIVSEQPDSYSVTGVEPSVPFLTATVRKLGEQELVPERHKDQYEVTLALAPDAPVGPISATVTVTTDHPKAKKIMLKVFGVVRALINVSPPELQFGSVEAKIAPRRNVMVVNNQPTRAVEVTGAEIPDPAFEAQVFPIEQGRRYQVTVTVKVDADAGSRDTVLTISTSDPDHPKLTVPVRASIQ